jgi:uncharacterized protein
MATVLITGGTGLIGRALTKSLLEKGYEVIILTRDPAKFATHTTRLNYAAWDPAAQTIDTDAITKTDHIIHLAGAGVADKRWSKKRKQEIVESRVKSGELLVKTLRETANQVQSVISSSAIGWYGPDDKGQNTGFAEDAPAAADFLGQTCKQWEASIEPVAQLGKRLVKLRTGIVLSKDGGALKEFLKPLRFGIASILGTGRQMISWIHIDDMVRLYITAIEKENMIGVYNAVAPSPVTNKQLIMALARKKRGRFFIPVYVPSFVLKIMLGEMSIEVLKSATVSCEKLSKTGFIFQYPTITAAFADIK